MIIKLTPHDNKIWNMETFIIDMMRNINVDDEIIVDLNGEGPCCASLGLDDLIEKILLATGTDRKKIIIETGNLIRSSRFQERQFCTFEIWKGLLRKKEQPVPMDFDYHFGFFVSRSNWKRLALGSYIWNTFADKSIMSYRFDPNSDYHRANFGLESYLFHNWQDESIYDFLKQLPINLCHHKTEMMTLSNDILYGLDSWYDLIFCDVVCETFFSGKTFYITEKTLRPIINRKPFVMQGPQWFLENLRRLGFKTFSKWWSEGYDEDINGGTLESIRSTLDFIASQDLATLARWYKEMQDILDHNLETLFTLSREKILSTEYKIPT